MTDIRLDSVRVAYGTEPVVRDVSFAVGSGQCLAVLGPSGCGKSTLLRAIAGIEPLAGGRVTVNGRDLAGVPTHKRGIGLMFQNHSLFPHMSTAANIGYGLRMAGWPRQAAGDRISELLTAVGLEGHGEDAVTALSGGEQQRVALARTLAPRPGIVLLDEPLGSLDRALREDLLVTMAESFHRDGTTVIYVTHDHSEAFELGDQVAVMKSGQILQESPPTTLWSTPATAWVARFLGLANILPRATATTLLPEALAVTSGSQQARQFLLRPDLLGLEYRQRSDMVSSGERWRGEDEVRLPVKVARTSFRGENLVVGVTAAVVEDPIEVWTSIGAAGRTFALGDDLLLTVPDRALVALGD